MSSFCFHCDFCNKKSQKPLWALGFRRRHLFWSAILAGAQGFEPRKCQSQSLMPYRLAMPHNKAYYNRLISFCQVLFLKFSLIKISIRLYRKSVIFLCRRMLNFLKLHNLKRRRHYAYLAAFVCKSALKECRVRLAQRSVCRKLY